jgi:esterase/lipase
MRQEPVEIIIDGLTLRGKLFIPEENKKNLAVLFLHGWTGMPNNDAAKALVQNGYTVMTFSFSGHNDSDGKLEDQTRAKSLKEVLAAYDYLKSKIPAAMPIGVAGTSYGSYMAALLSAERDVACLQLRVPANYWDEQFSEPQVKQGGDNPEVMKWREKILDAQATKSLRAINNFHGPIQILEAELDDLVPHQTILNYIDAVQDKSKLEHHFMPGWPHSLGDDTERNKQYQDILLNWLNKQI